MERFFAAFGAAYRMVGVIILAAMVVIVFVNACMRYAFNSGFIATEEVLRYLFIYMTFIGIVEVAYQRGHISVTIVTDFLKGRVRTLVYLGGYFLMLFAIYVLIDGTYMYFEESESSVGQVTGLPFRYIIGCLMFGALGLLVFILRDIYCACIALKTGEDFPPRLVDEDVEAAIASMEQNEAQEGELAADKAAAAKDNTAQDNKSSEEK